MRRFSFTVLAAVSICAFSVLGAPSAAIAADDAADSETAIAPGESDTSPADPAPELPADPADKHKPFIPKYQRGSGQRAGGPANELNTGEARAAEKLPGGSVTGALTGRELYHGNYCGTGSRGPGLPPADDLDAACMRHDQCYETAGRRSCACDAALKREAVLIADSNVYSRELRARAGSVVEAAELMECQRP